MGNFTGTFNLKNVDDQQAIYFSQLYGTFFGVYGQAVLNNTGDELVGLKVWLLNYKGPLNIGFVRSKLEQPSIQAFVDTDGFLSFQIFVKALSPDHGENNSVIIPINGVKVSDIKGIYIIRELDKMNDKKDRAYLNEVFDEEFYDRDGVDREPRNHFDDKSPGKRCKTSRLIVVTP